METIPYELLVNISQNISAMDVLNLCQSHKGFSRLYDDWLFWYNLAKPDIHKYITFTYEDFRDTVLSPSQQYFRAIRLLGDPYNQFFEAIRTDNVDDVIFLLKYIDPTVYDTPFGARTRSVA